MRFQCGWGYQAWGCSNRGWLGQKVWEVWQRYFFIMLPLHVCTENSATRDTIIIGQCWDRDARLHERFQILLYRVCQERLLDFTMNWQRCRERMWACDSSDVRGPGRQPGSVLIASLPAPWLDRFPFASYFSAVHWCSALCFLPPGSTTSIKHSYSEHEIIHYCTPGSQPKILSLSLSPPLSLFSSALIFLSSFSTILQKAINSEWSLSVHPSLSICLPAI